MSESLIVQKKPRFDFTAETLPEHPLFKGLGVDFRKILAECAMRADYEAGDTVVEAGEGANGFYLIIRGSMDLEAPGHRRGNRVQTLGEGDILGWSWLFPPYYWHFNAVARDSVQTIFFYGSRLRQQCDRNHDFGYELVKSISRILIGHLQINRKKWIEAATLAPAGTGLATEYLVI